LPGQRIAINQPERATATLNFTVDRRVA